MKYDSIGLPDWAFIIADSHYRKNPCQVTAIGGIKKGQVTFPDQKKRQLIQLVQLAEFVGHAKFIRS